jgi:hypothetical protein
VVPTPLVEVLPGSFLYFEGESQTFVWLDGEEA